MSWSGDNWLHSGFPQHLHQELHSYAVQQLRFTNQALDGNLSLMPADIQPPFSVESVTFDSSGLVPVIVQDAQSGQVLMLAYANREALTLTLESRRATYFSRSRQRLWVKGEESGHTQRVQSVTLDCDGDAVLYKVEQTGPACHKGERSCFHNPLLEAQTPNFGETMKAVYQTISSRLEHPEEGSYVSKLHAAGLDRVLKKIGEEAGEVIIAAKNGVKAEVQLEVADLFFHTMLVMAETGLNLEDIARELQGRQGKRRET